MLGGRLALLVGSPVGYFPGEEGATRFGAPGSGCPALLRGQRRGDGCTVVASGRLGLHGCSHGAPGRDSGPGQRAWPAGRTWPLLTLTGTSGKPVRQRRREIDWLRSKDQKPGAQEVVGTTGPRLGQPASPMRVCLPVPQRDRGRGGSGRPHPALRSLAGLQGRAGCTGACQTAGVSRDPRDGGHGTRLGGWPGTPLAPTSCPRQIGPRLACCPGACPRHPDPSPSRGTSATPGLLSQPLLTGQATLGS